MLKNVRSGMSTSFNDATARRFYPLLIAAILFVGSTVNKTERFARRLWNPVRCFGTGEPVLARARDPDGAAEAEWKAAGQKARMNWWAEVEAGIAWSEVLRAAIARGRTPPVVTDWLSVSVGGTLSMGGFGFMSYHRGTQMDHLIELEAVTGEGERRVCSPSSDRQLFDAVRATHGQLAIITRARIPLERAPRKVRMLQAAYGSVESLLSDMERLAREKGAGGGGSVDLVHGFAAQKTAASVMTRMNSTQQMRLDRAAVDAALAGVGGDWVFNLEMSALVLDHDDDPSARRLDLTRLGHLDGCIDEWELSWEEFCFRKPPLILEEQFHGAAPHPELTVFLPFSSEATALMVAEFERLHPIADIGGGPVLLFPLDRTRVTAPYLVLPAPSHGFFLGLLRRAEPPTADRISSEPSSACLHARASFATTSLKSRFPPTDTTKSAISE